MISETQPQQDCLIPNSGNGYDYPDYSWTQTLNTIEIVFKIPDISRSFDVEILPKTLTITDQDSEVLLHKKTWFKAVVYDDCLWVKEDDSIVLTVYKRDNTSWWEKLFVEEPKKLDLQKVQPENSNISDLDPETRMSVEKMMYDQKQKQMGLPTSEVESKQEILAKFMKQHPEMDFSSAKFS
ncbi:MAG: hypothetical protein MHMPM18_000678 [Marteilia pararefringens]